MDSQFKNIIEIVGSVSLVLTDTLTNRVKQEIYVPNLVVTTGKYYIAGRMITAGLPTEMQYMGIGTGSTAEVVGNTQLSSELSTNGYARVSTARAVTDNVVTYVATFPANNPISSVGVALQEAGIFSTNAAGSGTMLCRTTFPVVTKQTADALTITWTITIQ